MLQAQEFDATHLSEVADLADGWLIHAGDDPSYARPDIDDSQWTHFNAQTDDLRNLFPSRRPEVVWYRLRLKVAPGKTGLALLENNIESAFEIYCNGQKILQVGQFAPFKPYSAQAQILLNIPEVPTTAESILIALRVHIPPADWSNPFPGYYSSNLKIGHATVLQDHVWAQIVSGNALSWLDDLVRLAMCIGALLLFVTQRERKEYLWLFLWVLCEFPNMALGIFSLTHTYPQSWLTVCLILSVPYIYFEVRMYCSFVGHKVGWKLQSFTVLTSIYWVYIYIAADQWPPPINRYSSIHLICYTAFVVLMAVVLPAIVIRQIRRSKHLEGVLLIPLILLDASFLLNWIYLAESQIPGAQSRALRWFLSVTSVPAGPFVLDIFQASEILQLVSLAFIVLIRSNRMSRQQALLESEMASAREIQKVIIPEQVESTPGYCIESIYEPAREVGGDFYQILPTGQGMLLVIGDVAGKGLPAAMLVSLLIGTIRTAAEETHAPDEILAKMNQRLIGRTKGGFSTALAARFTTDGVVTIANAGHLAPYLDGREVALPGALPLGIVSNPNYESIQAFFERGSRLTFYTDGVVEAQDKHGDLFGFERARDLSLQTASVIANAAKAFGQEDDITVITIERITTKASEESDKTTPSERLTAYSEGI